MTEIEKLYELAGVNCKPNYVYNKVPILSGLKYPPFTAEKQIELIKWLSKDDVVRIEKYTLSGETFYELAHTFDDWFEDYKYTYATESFEEALAGLINSLWQDLTEEEQNEIKNILKG